ncbi:MAG TPA: twin-arginine translocase TatA/TatE family subunit [Opitutae bacterium]|nr:twin-arginine translocase TatA/TatE family subunit [Opitutae bacterium]|tara:strand:- start:9685 stop:9987 length:303 start_codon:yes stop_codon:yes gene_type:complete
MIDSTTLQIAFIGNIGGWEVILVFLIVLLLFGAKKVPELFRSLGKGVNEFRKAKSEWESDISDVMNQEPLEDHDFKKEKHAPEDSVPTNSESTEQEKQTT